MRDILRLSLPLTLWLASFSAIYGLHGLICAEVWPLGRPALLAGAGLALAVQVAVLIALRSPRFAAPSGFVRWVSLTLAVAALVATGWSLLPVLAASTC